MRSNYVAAFFCLAVLLIMLISYSATAAEVLTHPAMRTVPKTPLRQLRDGPSRFVDSKLGDDAQAGSEAQPWKTLRYALRQLKPGDTLYLRGGIFYERPALSQSGTIDAPITIQSYPGETVIIDGGLREFFEQPASSWKPFTDGAPGEFVSTHTYHELNDRRVPHQFLSGSWEPMWSKEDERPIAVGHFGETMVPLHGYRHLSGLRAANEFWLADKNDRSKGVYCVISLYCNVQ